MDPLLFLGKEYNQGQTWCHHLSPTCTRRQCFDYFSSKPSN